MAKILIVDDSRTSRKVLKTILEEGGHEVIGEATDGLTKFKELSPDITTLDITMPVMDGLQALKAIKEVDSSAKIVMVTAAGQHTNMVDALKLGASEFVTKPFESEAILAVINKM